MTDAGEQGEGSGNSSQDRGPMGTGNYVVQPGDCMDSIAMAHGFFWETLWDLPENRELRAAREDPNVLLTGDLVFIPNLREKTVEGATEERHRFLRRGVPSELRVRVLRAGQPRGNERYVLEIDGELFDGQTDADGWIEIAIPPSAERGELRVGEGEFDMDIISIEIGGMDPITELIGVQKRLVNLGYACEANGEMDDETREAIAAFQEAQELEATGELDETTSARLVEAYGR